jgi:hypothetical protein
MTLLVLELNEINFEQVQAYAAGGHLPHLADLVARHGISETTSELAYEELEPWIQWVTAHTGRTLAEHGIERLGDIVGTELEQIWEVLERQGVRVGAISPMNAANRCRDAAFFLPDPWTPEPVTGSGLLRRLHRSVAQMVNDNAASKVTAGSAANLLIGLLRYGRLAGAGGYAADLLGAARGRPWRKAMMLDRLLADVFITETRRHRPSFATLFLNAGAHIQHHYLFNSATYEGSFRNPAWYVRAADDPVTEVYELYDAVVGQVRRVFPDARLMIATGLHQDPHGAVTFYWRLKDHAAFLRSAEVPFRSVEARMSRDFVMLHRDAAEAQDAEQRLARITGEDGRPLFAVDNRGDSLFVMLTWPEDISLDFVYLVDGRRTTGLRDQVAFVAIKNGEHNGIGYFIDTARTPDQAGRFALAELPRIMTEACGMSWSPATPAPLASAAA